METPSRQPASLRELSPEELTRMIIRTPDEQVGEEFKRRFFALTGIEDRAEIWKIETRDTSGKGRICLVPKEGVDWRVFEEAVDSAHRIIDNTQCAVFSYCWGLHDSDGSPIRNHMSLYTSLSIPTGPTKSRFTNPEGGSTFPFAKFDGILDQVQKGEAVRYLPTEQQ